MRWILVFAFLTVASAQTWEMLGEGYHLSADSTADSNGNVYFSDERKNRILKIDLDGKIRVWKEDSHGTHGVAWGPDGRLYGGQHDRKRIVAFTSDGTEKVITEGDQSHHLKVSSRNEVYFSVPPARKVMMVDPAGKKRVVYEGLSWPRAMAISPEGRVLMLNDPRTKWVWRFEMAADGSLINGRQFCALETRGGSTDIDPGGMAFDADGLLYVASKHGVQVCDKGGRVVMILDTPGTEGVSDVLFGGPGLKWLYVTAWDKVYRRPFKGPGAK
jgi:gluconolactonase